MLKVLDIKTFYRFFLLICFSSSLIFLINPEFCNFGGILTLVGLSVLFSTIICFISSSLRKCPRIRKIFEGICVAVILLIILVEVFLYVNFGILIDETVFNIIEGTNVKESTDFLMTYFNTKTIGALSGVLVIFALIFWGVSPLLSRLPKIVSTILIWLLVSVSVIKIVWAIYSSISFGFGGHLSAYSSFSRIARSCYIYWSISNETNLLIDNLDDFGEVDGSDKKCDKMVVIIGESYSKYHSQLYGYPKNTSPLLQEKVDNGELILFTDVITPINDTERSFRAVYSLGEYYKDTYYEYTLFPYVLKSAGYYTVNIDNMDLASKTSRVKDSRRLSDIMFDYRNVTTSQYDEGILDWLDVDEKEYPYQLFVIKLKGQHYDYAAQFPESFAKYQTTDYPEVSYPENKVQLIADYDNATIYNDYVVNSIIEYFRNDNSVVMYFSDHGEEVYDERDYMGHGGTTPHLNYQVEIPFMIWMSESYRQKNPDIAENIQKHRTLPYVTDDVSHTILSMTGVKCFQYVPERSLANDAFNPREERIILKSYVYEQEVKPNNGCIN